MQPLNRKVDLENLLHELDDKSEMTHNSIYRPDQSELNSIKIGHSSSRNHSRELAKTKVSQFNLSLTQMRLLSNAFQAPADIMIVLEALNIAFEFIYVLIVYLGPISKFSSKNNRKR